MNAKRTVRGYANAGFAGILMEDQVAPCRAATRVIAACCLARKPWRAFAPRATNATKAAAGISSFSRGATRA